MVGVYKSGVYETVRDCALAYGISPKTLGGWLNNYYKKSTPSALSDQQAEFDRLKKSSQEPRWRMKY